LKGVASTVWAGIKNQERRNREDLEAGFYSVPGGEQDREIGLTS
jgi:hypothetical protein